MSQQSGLERYEQRTEWLLAAIALTFLALYSIKVLARPQGPADRAIDIALIAIYFMFVVDYLFRLRLAEPRLKWFLKHLWEIPVLVLPFLRPLRLLSLAAVVNALQRAVGHTIRGRVIIYTACGAVAIVYAASLAILEAERDAPDTEKKISTIGEALWWAMTTVTTVGYGDLHPTTTQGRFVAVALMIGGITLLGSITATLASWIVQQVGQEDKENRAATAAHIEELRDEIRRLEAVIRSNREDNDGGQVEGSG